MINLFYIKLIALALFTPIISCSQEAEVNTPNQPQVTSTTNFLPGTSEGILDNKELIEISGLAASTTFKNSLWVHNDSGNDPVLYLVSIDAKLMRTYFLEVPFNIDWEDMSMGPGPDKNQQYIYIGDIGDNQQKRTEKYIYRFSEPSALDKNSTALDTIRQVEIFTFTYPSEQENAEAMMVDPLTGDIYIVAKNLKAPSIYKIAADKLVADELITPELIGELNISSESMFDLITAGDISDDGREILIKSYGKVYYWLNEGNVALSELLTTVPDTLEYTVEPQGEAITFSNDPNGFFTISEKRFNQLPVMYFYGRE